MFIQRSLEVLVIILRHNREEVEVFLNKNDKNTFYHIPRFHYQNKFCTMVGDAVHYVRTNICEDVKKLLSIENANNASISIFANEYLDYEKWIIMNDIKKDNREAWVTANVSDVFKQMKKGLSGKWIRFSEVYDFLDEEHDIFVFSEINSNKMNSLNIESSNIFSYDNISKREKEDMRLEELSIKKKKYPPNKNELSEVYKMKLEILTNIQENQEKINKIVCERKSVMFQISEIEEKLQCLDLMD